MTQNKQKKKSINFLHTKKHATASKNRASLPQKIKQEKLRNGRPKK